MRILLGSLSLLISSSIFAQTYVGKVVNVADGDTFTILLSNNTTRKIRLFGVDCPESKQDFGRVAKEFTKDHFKGRSVTVVQKGIDRYDRTVGMVLMGNDTLNVMLLKSGLAWHFKKYDKNAVWDSYELKARKARVGLWSMLHPIPPWEWRKNKRTNHNRYSR